MKFTSSLVLTLVCSAIATPAVADITLKQKNGGSGIGVAAAGETIQYVKGLKIRTDRTADGKTTSMIIDIAGKRMISLNPEKKEADVIDMTKIGDSLGQMPISDIKVTITPTGQTRQIAGSTCTVHEIKPEVPMNMGGTAMSIVMSGPHCLVKNGPGQADFAALYKAAAENGFIFSDPRQAKGQPSQAKAMTEMYRKMSELGVPFASEMKITF